MAKKLNLISVSDQIEIARREYMLAQKELASSMRAMRGRKQILKSLEALLVLQTEGNKI